MRRVARFVLYAIAFATGATALLSAVAWPVSDRRTVGVIARVWNERSIAVGMSFGRVILFFEYPEHAIGSRVIWVSEPTRRDRPPRDPQGMWRGFYLEMDSGRYAIVPVPAVILILALSSAAAWHRAARLRPPPDPTRCAACGYDLRATPDRCPECGTMPAR